MEEEKNLKKEENKSTNEKNKSKSRTNKATKSDTKSNEIIVKKITKAKTSSKSETEIKAPKTRNKSEKEIKDLKTSSKSETKNKETKTRNKGKTEVKTSNTISKNETQSKTPKTRNKSETKSKEDKMSNNSEAKSDITKTTKTTRTISKTKNTTKKVIENKNKNEEIDIAFIENEEESPDENNEVSSLEQLEEIDNEKLLIDQKALEQKQLETIKDVIKKNKKEKKNKASKQDKYKKILKNLLLGIASTLYFLILIVGKAVLPTIEYITCLKYAMIAELIASIIIFEVAYKKDKEELFLHGLEMLTVTSATLIYLHFFSMEDSRLNIIGAVIIGIVNVYYLIKSMIIAIKKNKKQ